MEDTGILGLTCCCVLHGPIPDGQGLKGMFEKTLNSLSLVSLWITNGLKKKLHRLYICFISFFIAVA